MESTNSLVFVLVLLAALGSGLIGGAFFAFSTFVMGALARVQPATGIAAMQSINVVVINPLFMLPFMGTALVCFGLSIFSFFRWDAGGSLLMLIGSALYIVGTFLVTILFNVPLNNALATVDPESANGDAVWKRYLTTWTMWNHVRTAAALVSAVLLMLVLVYWGG
jgi:uncharacterized membrane protein